MTERETRQVNKTAQIVISNPAVASIRVSGQFRAGDVQRFATTLAEMHQLRALRQANRIELAPPQ